MINWPQTTALQELVEHKFDVVFGPEPTYYGRDKSCTFNQLTETINASAYTSTGQYGPAVISALEAIRDDILLAMSGQAFFVGAVVVAQGSSEFIKIHVFWQWSNINDLPLA